MPEAMELSDTSPHAPLPARTDTIEDESKVDAEDPAILPSPRSVHGVKVRRWQEVISLVQKVRAEIRIFNAVGILSSILIYALDTTITTDVIPVSDLLTRLDNGGADT